MKWMSFTAGVSASPGVLLMLREQLSFIIKGKEILEMKRDRIAGEINKLLNRVKVRAEAEEMLVGAYEALVKVLMRIGYRDLKAFAESINYIDLSFKTDMVMGISLVDMNIVKDPNINIYSEPLVRDLAIRLFLAFKKILETAVIENNIEVLANELMSTSRKVNSLEKIVIPEYWELIRYIEEKIFEESLSEFVRTKHILSR